jgi:hypothetical protein
MTSTTYKIELVRMVQATTGHKKTRKARMDNGIKTL